MDVKYLFCEDALKESFKCYLKFGVNSSKNVFILINDV